LFKVAKLSVSFHLAWIRLTRELNPVLRSTNGIIGNQAPVPPKIARNLFHPGLIAGAGHVMAVPPCGSPNP
jgi:hypothetical protein